MLVSYSWAWGLFWSVIEILSEISLENTDFFSPFANGSPLQIASLFELRPCLHSILSTLGLHLACICAGPVNTITVSLNSCVNQYYCVCKALLIANVICFIVMKGI